MLPESRRHTHEYKVRLTEAEAAAVDALAGIVGVPPAVYLRLLITHQLVEQANHIPIFTAAGCFPVSRQKQKLAGRKVIRQSRLGSLIESVMNVAIGFGVALISQILVFPLFGIYIGISDNLGIAAWFTGISIARSYLIRRWFEARLRESAERIAGVLE